MMFRKSPVIVLVEWRGPDRPSVVWFVKHGREQWLSQETIDQMGAATKVLFYAELAGDTWHIAERVQGIPGARDTLRKAIPRPGSRIMPLPPPQKNDDNKSTA